MPAPTVAFYDTAVKVALSGELLALLDVYGTCYCKIFSDADVLLAQIYFTDPPGSVGTDGVLTLTPAGPDASANASGTAAYLELYNPDDELFYTIPITEGATAIPGWFVMSSTTVVEGEPVSVTGFTLG